MNNKYSIIKRYIEESLSNDKKAFAHNFFYITENLSAVYLYHDIGSYPLSLLYKIKDVMKWKEANITINEDNIMLTEL